MRPVICVCPLKLGSLVREIFLQARKLSALAQRCFMSSRRLDAHDACPVRDGFAMPAEWTTHARTWMAWPCRLEPWGSTERMLLARVAYARVARAISGFEKVMMAVRPQDCEEAQMACGKGIDFFEVP